MNILNILKTHRLEKNHDGNFKMFRAEYSNENTRY